jgi:chromosome segregation ATPase
MVGRAFSARRQSKDPVPNLGEVLTELHVSAQKNDQGYEINRIHFADASAAEPPPPAPIAGSAPPDLEAHRRRLEQLLENARQIEEMLAKEAAQAVSLSENLNLDDKRIAAAKAAEEERKALAEAKPYAQNSETAIAYQAKVDGELAAAVQELNASELSVKELQARLADAQNFVVLAKAKVVESQARAKEAAKRAEVAKALVRDAEVRVAKCREAREAAEAEVRQGEEIASRVAMAADTLKRIREIGKSGVA